VITRKDVKWVIQIGDLLFELFGGPSVQVWDGWNWMQQVAQVYDKRQVSPV
jgi:hypothetical protein